MKRRLWALAIAGVVVFTACGGSDSGGQIEADDVVVEMYDNRFQYTEIEIPVGGTITWAGAGQNPHNSVAANGEWSTEEVFGSLEQYEGDNATITYDEPGEYTFYCTLHGNAEGDGMAGTLVVGGG